ncbi:MAG: lactate utilization protein [Gemmatimonadota bacterium]|nr:MAG: lactate utilization protein [Gemmatimonadota bacterium]
MMGDVSTARNHILGRLRSLIGQREQIFRQQATTGLPDPPMTVFPPPDDKSLVESFAIKLAELAGSCDVVRAGEDVAERIVKHVGKLLPELESEPTEILSWAADELHVPRLEQTLAEANISLFVPDNLHDQNTRSRASVLDVGLTAVEAAFANTGSIALTTGVGRSRAAGLLPLNHLALVPLSRLYPTFEAWLWTLRQDGRLEALLHDSGQLAFVTGPSKSADIELTLTLGVHGPKTVHAIVFDDSQ